MWQKGGGGGLTDGSPPRLPSGGGGRGTLTLDGATYILTNYYRPVANRMVGLLISSPN